MTEWRAGDYHQHSSLQQAMAEEQLGQLTLRGDERVLDVGSGDGKISAAIAARVPSGSVVGTDPSRDMIAFATKNFAAATIASPAAPTATHAGGNLRFEVGDVRHLPYRGEFDLVVSFNALHWVPEQAAALSSIAAALKPGGHALLRFVAEGPRKCLEDVIEDVRRDERWSRYFPNFRKPYVHFTADQYRPLVAASGLRVERLNVEDRSWDFKTREGFAGFARATFAEWMQHLPESDWQEFITDVLDRYQTVAADNSSQASTFKFYQMEVVLVRGE